MRVVIIDGDVSYPATSGKRLRTLNLMLQLAEHHEIIYLARADDNDPSTEMAREFLADHGIRAELVHDPLPVKRGLGFCVRLAANLASPLPYSVASHQSDAMRHVVNRLAAEQPIDLWQCEWSGYLSTVREQPHGRRLCMAHNVDALIWRRYFEVERNPLRRLYVREQWRKFLRFERKAFRDAGQVVAVTQDDATLLRDQFGICQVEVVDNGIDCHWIEQFDPAQANGGSVRRPLQYLFLGALDWRPNQDAVGWLLDEIVPLIRTRHADAQLLIVGRNPSARIQQRCAKTAGVRLHADVPDVRPYLAQSQVMVVPLRIGGGSRLKILEALAAGLPVVSTTVGAEGLRITPDQHYLSNDTADGIAASVVECFNRPDWARTLAEQGKEVVQRNYDWPILAQRLNRIWEKSVSRSQSAGNTAGGKNDRSYAI